VTWEELTRIFGLQNYRRLTVRWEHRLDNFPGMLHLACAPHPDEAFMRWVLICRIPLISRVIVSAMQIE
jgi:hypothetical protein